MQMELASLCVLLGRSVDRQLKQTGGDPLALGSSSLYHLLPPSTSMHRLASTARPRPLLSSMSSAALARRVSPRFAAANPPTRRVSRSSSSSSSGGGGVKGSTDDKHTRAAGAETPDRPMDDVPLIDILPDSSHRDGSIYGGTEDWKRSYRVADRNERVNDVYRSHGLLASSTMENAVSHTLESSHVPDFFSKGSLINIAGPKRGIQFISPILIEYDMKIKTGEHEKEDLQLIDGVSHLDPIETSDRSPFTFRIQGDRGAIDVGASHISFAVEATIEVVVSQVHTGFGMRRLGCFTSGIHEEIRLFDGAISESCGLRRSVVAVQKGARMELKFKVASDSCIHHAEYRCSFEANKHGHATREIKTGFALIAVKVSWSTLKEL